VTCTASNRDGSECRSRVSEWCAGTSCLLHCKRDHGVMACEFKPSGGLGNEEDPEAR
jgi:hypothetical protein